MSNCRKKSTKLISSQGNLFDMSDGCMDIRLAFRDTLSKAIRKSQYSRWQLAAEISRLANRDISKNLIDKYTSNDFNYAFKAEDLPAVLYVVGDTEPLRALISPLAIEVLNLKDAKIFRLQKLLHKKEALDKEIDNLSKELSIDIPKGKKK